MNMAEDVEGMSPCHMQVLNGTKARWRVKNKIILMADEMLFTWALHQADLKASILNLPESL